MDQSESSAEPVEEQVRRPGSRGPLGNLLTRSRMRALRDDGLTYQQIGDIFGVSRQRVHQLLNLERYHQYRTDTRRRHRA